MSRAKKAARNIVWNGINKFLAVLFPFLTRTAILYKLGNEYIGLNSLFISILGLLSLSELGIGTALVFNMYDPLAKGDVNKVAMLMQLYKKCYRIIGVIVLAIGILISPFLPKLIAGSTPNNINIYLIYAMYLLNTVASYWLFAYKKSLLIASQRVDIQSNINSVVLFSQNIAQVVILIAFSNYYLYILVLPLFTIIENVIVSIIVDKSYSIYLKKVDSKISEISGMKKLLVGILFQRIGNVVLFSVDSIVISMFLGLTVLGEYNNYYYVINALFGLLIVFQNSLKPIVANSIILETKEKNYNDFLKINFIYIWIVTWSSCFLLCLYQPFINMWAGRKSLLSFEIVITLVVYFFVFKLGDMLFVYQEASGLWWETKFIPIIAGTLNLFLNIILINSIGLIGVPISTIISILLIYDIGYSEILFKKCFDNEKKVHFYFQEIRYILFAIIACLLTYYFCSLISLKSIYLLLMKIAICIIVPNIVLMILHRKNPIALQVVERFYSKKGK